VLAKLDEQIKSQEVSQVTVQPLPESTIEQFQRFLRMTWLDNTEEEALFQWQQRVHDLPKIAQNDLECLEAVLAAPPPNLIEMLNDDGWIILSHEPDEGTEEDYSYDEYLQWLRQMTIRFHAMYDAESAASQ
jgi:hypothetical protein